MPKQSQHPAIYNELKKVTTTFLKEHGYLKPNWIKSGSIYWSGQGETTSSISISVNTFPDKSYLELNYNYRNTPIRYRVPLVSFPSNLGIGVVWFFVCPCTGKRCRKLYLKDGYFLQRAAFTNCLYKNQELSKRDKELGKILNTLLLTNQLFEQLCKKHFKSQYNGKPTRKYLRLLKQISNIEHPPQKQVC